MQKEQRQYECVHRLFEAQAQSRPEAIAVRYQEQELSYEQLNERANQLAHHLLGLGVGPETRVGLCVERSLEMVVALLGILKAGAAYVPLDPEYPQQRLAFMLADAEVSVLLTQESLLSRLPESEQPVLCLDRDWPEIAKQSRATPAIKITPDNLAYLVYTSGSTGQPKGAAIPHRSIGGFIFGVDYVTWDEKQTLLQYSSLSWDALTLELWPALLRGGRCVLYAEPRVSLPSLAAVIKDEGVSVLWLTSSLFNAVLDTAPELLRGVSQVLVGGEALSGRHVRQARELWPEMRLVNGYGPSECTVFACCHVITNAEVVGSSVPIGRPIGDRKVYVLDGHLKRVPVGVAGELYIGGASLARGYWKQAGLTAERFIPHPYSEAGGERLYRTGDLVRHRSDGELEFVGRVDEQVKVRGYRIELGEIESVLKGHAAVAECVVVAGTDGEDSNKRLLAYLVTRPDQTLTLDELRSFLREQLPEYMIPAAFIILDALPLNAHGKLDRQALPAPDSSSLPAAVEFVAPRTPEEAILAGIWAQVLKVERLGVHDNFFELGGDSILSIQVVSRAFQQGLHLLPKQLFQHQTIAELAQVVTTKRLTDAEQGEVTGVVALTPIQHWFFSRDWPQLHHFNYSMVFEVHKSLDLGRVKAVVAHLLSHHDALRMRYERSEAGWQQRNASVAEQPENEITYYDLRELGPPEVRREIERVAEQAQRSLNLETGPLMRVLYFDMGGERGGRLLLIVHHLVMDGVSWRILLEDLQLATQQLERGVAIELPAKTTSYQSWARRLSEYGGGAEMVQEAQYWGAVEEQLREQVSLPVDHEGVAAAIEVDEHRELVIKVLGEEQTRALLSEVGAAYHTQIQEVLLAALVEAIWEWTGERQVVVQMEGHGREELFEQVDLTRTVGWFTSLYPLRLDLRRVHGVGEVLQAVKEQVRAVPGRGVGYGIWKYLRVTEGEAAEAGGGREAAARESENQLQLPGPV